MLGKLLKHEIKYSARYVMLVYACAGAATVFMLLAMLVKSTRMTLIGSIVLEIVGVAVVIMTLVSVIKNFYDTLYGSQGYLSFTLPVKCGSLLISKVITSFFWILLSAVLLIIIMLIIFWNARVQSDGALDGLIDMIRSSGMLDASATGGVIAKMLLFAGLEVLFDIFVFVGFVYFAITLANTRALQNHPKLFGILIFFVSYSAANSIASRLSAYLPLSLEVSAERVGIVFEAAGDSLGSMYGLGGIIFMVIVAACLLITTGWIMEHKVNIK